MRTGELLNSCLSPAASSENDPRVRLALHHPVRP